MTGRLQSQTCIIEIYASAGLVDFLSEYPTKNEAIESNFPSQVLHRKVSNNNVECSLITCQSRELLVLASGCRSRFTSSVNETNSPCIHSASCTDGTIFP